MAVRIGDATIGKLMTAGRNPQQVLIAGAGVAGLEAALALQALTEDEVSVELLAPVARAPAEIRPRAQGFTFRSGPECAVRGPFGRWYSGATLEALETAELRHLRGHRGRAQAGTPARG